MIMNFNYLLYLEFIIEVGPGPGGITRKLFEHGAGRVAAIEKDIRLFPALQVNNIKNNILKKKIVRFYNLFLVDIS